jgi:hypothetical protein
MNKRVVLTGAAMIGLAAGFFLWSLGALAPKSNNPAAMMQAVGTVCGAFGGIGLAMSIFGLLRRK